MCGRFFIPTDAQDILAALHQHCFPLEHPITLDSKMKTGEIFPCDRVPIIIKAGDSYRYVVVQWGFPSAFSKKPLINARSETVHEKKSFQEAFFRRRCIVPAAQYYEWKQTTDGHKSKYGIHFKQKLFFMAGIFNKFISATGENFWSFVILTRTPLPEIAYIHDRMPVILSPENTALWLSPQTPVEKITHCLLDFSEEVIAKLV